jgi:hypothetical protein
MSIPTRRAIIRPISPLLANIILVALLLLSLFGWLAFGIPVFNLCFTSIWFFAIYFMVFAFRTMRLSAKVYDYAPRRELHDVSHEGRQPTLGQTRTIELLQNEYLFERLGEAEPSTLPHEDPETLHVLASPKKTIIAEIIYLQDREPSIHFLTWFKGEKDMLVETSFASGITVETEDYDVRAIPSTVPNTYLSHRQRVNEYRAEYREPSVIEDMDTYLAFNQRYRKQYIQKRLRPAHRRTVRNFIWTLAFFWSVTVVMVGLWLRQTHPVFIVISVGVFLLVTVSAAFVFRGPKTHHGDRGFALRHFGQTG